MTRLVFVTVMVGVLAVSRLASAQSTGSDTGTGTLPNGATIEFQHLKVYDPDNKEFIETEANSDDRLRGFNRAQCNCARKHTTKYTGGGVPAVSDPKSVGWFQYLVIESASSGLHVPVEFWVGSECTVDETRLMTCKQLPYAQISDLDNSLFAKNGTYLSFNLYDVVNGKLHDEDTATTTDPGSDSGSGSDPASCQPLETNSPIYAFVSSTGSSDTFDYETSQNAGTLSTDADTTANGIDTDPPVPPTNVQATASDQSINIKWTPPSDRNTDVAYYQALCADMTGSVVKHRVADHKYVTTKSLCSDAAPSDYESESLTATASSSANNEMPVGPLVGGAFGDLHDAFICGEASSATANSLSITGLTNGTPYQVIFLEIDLHGNFVGTYFDHTITPVPVTDFWEDLHDRGSKTEGGLCLLAETYGDDSGLTQTLRAFRDDTLGGSPVGRWFGRAYYATLGRLGWLVHGSLALRIVSGVVLSPLVVLALLWHWLTLPGLFALIVAARLAWRRRRALRRLAWSVRAGLVRAGLVRRAGLVAGAGVAALLLVAAPGRAHADKPDPYWQNDPLDSSTDSNGAPTPDPNFDPNFDPSIPTDRNANNPFAEAQANDNPQDVPPSEIHWHVGLRIGPYTPDIDKQLGQANGPFAQMFGGYRMLPMLDVDRVLWTGFGQVAVGGTIGYYQKTASAFTDASTPADNPRMRVGGAENKFVLIPFAVTASYRFTWLDDEYGVPIVPYVRGGLSYYVWWVSSPTGDLAEVCKGGGMEPMCDQNTARGASLGVQGTIGLAIRAERIDASAATSMRQAGIQHAGIFGELSAAQVDGFGSDTKLSVGDRTWFAGVDFEF